MAITRWRPLTEIDEIFRDLSLLSGGQNGRDLATDIYAQNGNIVVEIQVAGIEPDNVEISVENNLLHVFGTREEEYEEDVRDYYSKEILRGSFERLVPLPVAVNEDKANANIEDGVLRIVLPKRQADGKKQVGVEKGKIEKAAKKSAKEAQPGKLAAKKKAEASKAKRSSKKETNAKSSARRASTQSRTKKQAK